MEQLKLILGIPIASFLLGMGAVLTNATMATFQQAAGGNAAAIGHLVLIGLLVVLATTCITVIRSNI